jgi:trehalose 6-phosphate phosphatase
MDNLHQKLTKNLGQIEGVIVENKGISLSIHYRLVDKSMLQKMRETFESTVKEAQESGAIRLTHGKKVFEVRPAIDMNKGNAIRMLINKYRKGNLINSRTLLPIYIGDDQTDEDGFRVVEEYDNGISIFVGDPQAPSMARYFLNSPDEVIEFLRMLDKQVQSGFAG